MGTLNIFDNFLLLFIVVVVMVLLFVVLDIRTKLWLCLILNYIHK